jgi:hypothetical protein
MTEKKDKKKNKEETLGDMSVSFHGKREVSDQAIDDICEDGENWQVEVKSELLDRA